VAAMSAAPRRQGIRFLCLFLYGRLSFAPAIQGCQIFLGPKYQKGKKIYQIITKYTKWP
jgi:hypothetical protein